MEAGQGQDHLDVSSAPLLSRRKSSSSGSGILSRLPFMRLPSNGHHAEQEQDHDNDAPSPLHVAPGGESLPASVQPQPRTRRRRGSLRKVALLGRGAQRGRSNSSPLSADTPTTPGPADPKPPASTPKSMEHYDALGLAPDDLTPRAPTGAARLRRSSMTSSSVSSTNAGKSTEPRDQESWTVYNSTTDEDDMVQLPHGSGHRRLSQPTVSPGQQPYFGGIEIASAQRRRSFHQAKSPLSYNGMPTTPGQSDSVWDYSETEWWGWVVLLATWVAFVIGMGSCLDVWSWAWDVGKTPYAPPELEDDPTLPIVGYYPCLIILTGVMAWVWVVVAWVGMKHFRHAKISGD